MYINMMSHSGILGMKWGKRNGPPYPLKESQKSSAEKKEQSTDQKERHEKKPNHTSKRTISEVSDEELARLIKRMQLERSYAELMSGRNKQQVSKGKKFASYLLDIAAKGGVTLSNELIKAYGKKLSKQMFPEVD